MRRRPSIRITLVLALTLAAPASVAGAEGSGQARYLASFAWGIDKFWFGGWSGIELSPDGAKMTAITDRGRLIEAEIIRDRGRIAAVKPRRRWRLKSSTGTFLTRQVGDSEGLAVAPDGTIYISFEGVTRVVRLPDPAGPSEVLRRPGEFRGFPKNKSLEALAIDHRNRLFAIPERLERDETIKVFVLDKGTWSVAFKLPGGNGFLPVGADFDADGRLYLLERAWNALGFRTRVRRWTLSDDKPGNEQLLIETGIGTHDNLEGLAIWRDKQGRTRLTMIADDNFLPLQQTELVEYVLQE